MQQKIAKVFSYFTDIKHENIFSLCVLQLAESYEDSPQALKPILYNLKTLFFPASKEARLKLKQRQLAASIIEKIIARHTSYLDQFAANDNVQEMENFHIEETTPSDTQTQVNSYPGVPWNKIPFVNLIQTRPLLMASQKRFKQTEEELKKSQAQFFHKLNDIKAATATNVRIFLGDLLELQDNSTTQAEVVKPSRHEKKIEKLNKKTDESLRRESISLTVFNPFNFIYQFAIENIMSPNWETRHLSVLLLKAILPWIKYIKFSFQLKVGELSKTETFTSIFQTCKREMKQFLESDTLTTLTREVAFQSIMVLALDRFADYQGQRSNIMIRSVAAKNLLTIFEELPKGEGKQILLLVKDLLAIKSQIQGGLSPFAWELRHSFVYWLYLVMEVPKNREYVFGIFKDTLIDLLNVPDEQEVILTVCQCLNLLSSEPFFTIDYARRVNNQLWNLIESLDDVSYSATKVFALLVNYLHLVEIEELDCLLRLKSFFTNRMAEVRREFYRLEIEILDRNFKLKTPQNYNVLDKEPTLDNIIPWTAIQLMQQVMVEEFDQNLDTLVDLGASLLPYLLADSEETIISQFCSNVVCVYEPLQNVIKTQFINKSNFQFIAEEERVSQLSDHINIRIWKMSRVVGQMLVRKGNFLQQRVLDPFICLGTEVDTRFLLINLGIISSAFRVNPSVASECSFLIGFVEKVLKLQSHQMNTSVIEVYETQFKAKLGEYKGTLQDESQIDLCEKNLESQSWQHRSKLHQLLLGKYDCNKTPELHVIISAIEVIVETQKDLLKHLKLLASYCYCCLLPNQQPKPLNIIIKSIQEAMRDQHYFFISRIASSCMVSLSNILLVKNKSIFVKFNTNTLNQIASKYEQKLTSVERRRGNAPVNSARMQAIGTYIEQMGKVYPTWLHEFQACFQKGFEQPEHLKGCLNLLGGTISHVIKIADNTFIEKLLDNLKRQLVKNPDQNKLQMYGIVKTMLNSYCTGWRPESNTFLQWFYDLIGVSQSVLNILHKSLEQNVAKLSPICCLFLLEAIRLMTGGGDLRQTAMGCLSNLLMGSFISLRKLEFSPRLEKIAQNGLVFVRDFKNINNFEYKIQIKHKLELRSYQLEGVKWLGFLTKYFLNGALCDDMGLGKTLQTLTVVENEHFKTKDGALLSLVVAPTTLIQHWRHEYTKYFSGGCLSPLCIFGKVELNSMDFQQKSANSRLLITSYSVIEKNVEVFQKHKFKFIILDEGHLIKNPKTNKFKALARLKSDHKVILSGTPVQNKLLDLWGIFQFLMPGYLGNEEYFKSKHQKLFNVNLMTFKEDDLLFSKEQKDSLEALHLKVMPFILRRLKREVLRELPDKIIQDYLCKMTPMQQDLYNQFHTLSNESKQKFDPEDYTKESSKALTVLNQMRKIVNHPNLVGKKEGYEASGKFLALKDLLDEMNFQDPPAITHKIIIFSRFNATLDLIQKLLFNKLYPTVKYLSLTGSTPQNKRFDVAQEFNDSFDIKVLLTTTSIGGYGLNLSSANVVIMFDHDYNPSVDMQAIDRAHRLGQKNILNVYRLIMHRTLEQKIMGIQRFKTNLASAIVNVDNASIKNIEDSKLPDLLQRVSMIQEPEKRNKISKSLYASMIKQMEKDVIEAQDYDAQF